MTNNRSCTPGCDVSNDLRFDKLFWLSIKLRYKKEETPSIICVGCEQRVPLWDEMEQYFASPEIHQRVRDMQEESAMSLATRARSARWWARSSPPWRSRTRSAARRT